MSAFVIWSLVAATAMFWALRFVARSPQAPAYAVAVAKTAALRGDLTRLFGAPPVVAAAPEEVREAPSRFRLVGVMAPRSSLPQGTGAYGVALIAVDGKPAKAYVVGARIDSDLVLQSVGLRTASMGTAKGTGNVTLELPPLPAPSVGVLPAPGGFTGGSAPPITGGPLPAGVPAPVPMAGMPQPPVMLPNGGVPQAQPGMVPGVDATRSQ